MALVYDMTFSSECVVPVEPALRMKHDCRFCQKDGEKTDSPPAKAST
jgi:hypothetical protein